MGKYTLSKELDDMGYHPGTHVHDGIENLIQVRPPGPKTDYWSVWYRKKMYDRIELKDAPDFDTMVEVLKTRLPKDYILIDN